MKKRQLKNYEIYVSDDGIVDSITVGEGVDYKRVYPYKYDKKLGCMVIQNNIKFTTLKSGFYQGRIEFY